MEPIRIYLAHDYGFKELGTKIIQEFLIPKIESFGYKVIDPWKIIDPKEVWAVRSLPYSLETHPRYVELEKKIRDGDNNGIVDPKTTGLIAILDGVAVNDGVCIEIERARSVNKKVLGYRGDYRRIGSTPASIVNAMIEDSIERSGGKIVTSLDSLFYELKEGRFFG